MTSRFTLFALLAVFLASACSDAKVERPATPQSDRDQRKQERGRLTGDAGIQLFGPKEDEGGGGSPLGVNSFLWRASLDTLSFMPFMSADPFGGTIITDWYEDPKSPGERFKVNVLILDRTLRSDGVKVTVFKQKVSGGTWRDQKVDDALGRSLEDTILTRARQLKIRQTK